MKIAIRYYTKTGNTKKLADAIANAIGIQAVSIDEPLTEDIDLLFLGSSVYGAGVDGKVKKFISSIDVSVGTIVNFGTAAFIDSTYKQVKNLVETKGLKMSDDEYHCRGRFTLMHRGKPDKKDLQDAAAFAKRIVGRG